MQGLEFPDGLVVKNLTFNVGDTSSIPSQQTKIPHAKEQRSPHAAAKRENPCTDVAREVNKYLFELILTLFHDILFSYIILLLKKSVSKMSKKEPLLRFFFILIL